jgi:hypothetical protein
MTPTTGGKHRKQKSRATKLFGQNELAGIDESEEHLYEERKTFINDDDNQRETTLPMMRESEFNQYQGQSRDQSTTEV